MSRGDIDPAVLDAMARAHEQKVADTYKLYGQRNGHDEPEAFSATPFQALASLVRMAYRAGLELLVIAIFLVFIAALALSGQPGTTP